MIIRKEEIKDYETVYSVVKRAFDSAEHADGNEQDLVNALRVSYTWDGYIEMLRVYPLERRSFVKWKILIFIRKNMMH